MMFKFVLFPFFLFVDASDRISLNPPEELKVLGSQEWKKIVSSTEDTASCWSLAIDRFRHLSLDCASSNERAKTFLSLTLTKCHFTHRAKRHFPDKCHLDHAFNLFKQLNEGDIAGLSNIDKKAPAESLFAEKKQGDQTNRQRILIPLEKADHLGHSPMADGAQLHNPLIAEIDKNLEECVSVLSDSAFDVHIQFFNHLDSICFFLHSTLWQERTEGTVMRLADMSRAVIRGLEAVEEQHSRLLHQQELSIRHQQFLLAGSEKLQSALDTGHSSLKQAFLGMSEIVQKEQSRLMSIFDETFSLISRILHLQQHIAGRLMDFESVLIYVALIILTFYVTATDATRSARASMYGLWTVMLFGEFCMWRLLYLVEVWNVDEPLIRATVRKWRIGCVICGSARWFMAWWQYKDPTTVIVHAFNDGIRELKEQISLSNTTKTVEGGDWAALPRGSISCFSDFGTKDLFDLLSDSDDRVLDPDYSEAEEEPKGTSPDEDSSNEDECDVDSENSIDREHHVDSAKDISSIGEALRRSSIGGALRRSSIGEALPRSSIGEAFPESFNSKSHELNDNQCVSNILPSGPVSCASSISLACPGPGGNPRGRPTSNYFGFEEPAPINNAQWNQHIKNYLDKKRTSQSMDPPKEREPFVPVEPIGLVERLVRRNPHRRSRPIVFRPPRPGCLEDVKYLHLNPCLLFESGDDFAQSILRSQLERLIPQSDDEVEIHANPTPSRSTATSTTAATDPQQSGCSPAETPTATSRQPIAEIEHAAPEAKGAVNADTKGKAVRAPTEWHGLKSYGDDEDQRQQVEENFPQSNVGSQTLQPPPECKSTVSPPLRFRDTGLKACVALDEEAGIQTAMENNRDTGLKACVALDEEAGIQTAMENNRRPRREKIGMTTFQTTAGRQGRPPPRRAATRSASSNACSTGDVPRARTKAKAKAKQRRALAKNEIKSELLLEGSPYETEMTRRKATRRKPSKSDDGRMAEVRPKSAPKPKRKPAVG